MSESYNVCVVGTGAAGGILAYRLAKAGLKVISLEQGNSVTSHDFQNMIAPQDKHFCINSRTTFPIKGVSFVYDLDFYAQPDTRSDSNKSIKQFHNYQILHLNGKLNLWNAISVRFSKKDFNSWPVKYEDLETHYDQVEKLIGVTGHRDGLEFIPDGEFIPPKPLRPVDKILLSTLEKIGPKMGIAAIYNRKACETRSRTNRCPSCGGCIQGCQTNSVYKFSNFLLPEISTLENYRIIYHAKCNSLIKDPETGKISSLTYLDTQMLQLHTIKAKIFVVAAGAIETPRILLNSGVANSSGLVGHFLQDSPKAHVSATLYKLWFQKETYDVGYGDNLLVVPSEYRGDDQLLFTAQWVHSYVKIPLYINSLQSFPRWLRPWIARRLFKSIATFVMFGPSDPVKSNRLSISKECDKYGVPKVDIHFQESRKEEVIKDQMRMLASKLIHQCSGLFVQAAKNVPGTALIIGALSHVYKAIGRSSRW